MKTCTTCCITQPFDNFYKKTVSKDGYVPKCKTCSKAYSSARYNSDKASFSEKAKRYRTENREKVSQKKAEYRESNKQKVSEYRKAYYQANKEKELALRAAYQKAFPEKCNAITAKRKAAQLQATPSWADMQSIENAYKEAKDLESKFGGEYHVHHIVPLVSDVVCGLHCHHNVTVITAEENHRIGNRTWPDMW